MSDHRSHEGPHRGGAGKGGWGKPGASFNAPKEGDDAEPEPEPEEPDNEISIEDFEAAKAAKKAALNAAMAKGATAKEVDSSAFASMTLAAKSEDVNEFSLDGAGPKAKRERERKAKEAAKLELGFKSAPTAPAEDRPARGAGGRGSRGRRSRRGPAPAAAARRRRRPPRRRSRRLRPQRQDRGRLRLPHPRQVDARPGRGVGVRRFGRLSTTPRRLFVFTRRFP